MPSLQTGNNVAVALKRQTAKGTPASGAAAIGLNVVPQQGLKLTVAPITSRAIRRDGQSTRDRHGSRKGDAAYQVEIGVGMVDDLLEAALRSTWTATVTKTQADFTSLTTTTSTIVGASGSFLTMGIRRGDMIQCTGLPDATNNGKWLRVLGVTATTITVPAASLVANAVADTTCSIIIAKTLVSGTTPTERYYTVEEFGQDISAGLLGTDFKITKFELSCQPDQNVVATVTLMGLDVAEQDTTANFTNPVYSTALPLVMTDGTIRIGGVDYSVLTGFTLTWDLGGNVPAGLWATAPDVFLSNAKLSGSFTAIRQDMTFFSAFRAETQVDLFVTLAEHENNPADFLSFYVGNAVLNGADAPLAADGPMIATVPWEAGIDLGGSDRASTTLKIATSAA